MKKYSLLLIILIALSFSGCSEKIQKVYVKPEIPKPFQRPQGKDFEVFLLKMDGKIFYSLSEKDAEILSENWIYYKNWAESNYNLLLSLRNEYLENNSSSNISKNENITIQRLKGMK